MASKELLKLLPIIDDLVDVIYGVLLRACRLNAGQRGGKISEVRTDLVEAVVHDGGEGRDLLLDVGSQGGGPGHGFPKDHFGLRIPNVKGVR